LSRIEELAIPPAWTDVWICRDPRGHLQATGRDDKGRKQFLYHPDWQESANLAKFHALARLGRALPQVRRGVAAQLRRRASCRAKTLALVVRLLDLTGMRVGSEEYVQENGAFGLTTLRRRHLQLNCASAEFRFPGKSRQRQVVVVEDAATIKSLQTCVDHGGKCLFAFPDGNEVRSIESKEVNDYLRELSGEEITAKDFRTWLATALAAAALFELRDEEAPRRRKSNVVQVTRTVAQRLGNTPAVCRGSYLDPRLLEAYQEGRFPQLFAGFRQRRRKWLRPEDQLLRHALERL
jgi:DNA topoisomerase-1